MPGSSFHDSIIIIITSRSRSRSRNGSFLFPPLIYFFFVFCFLIHAIFTLQNFFFWARRYFCAVVQVEDFQRLLAHCSFRGERGIDSQGGRGSAAANESDGSENRPRIPTHGLPFGDPILENRELCFSPIPFRIFCGIYVAGFCFSRS